MDFQLPSLPGTYAVVLSSPAPRSVVVGKLGTLGLKPGFYIYMGSAFGPGGLRARIGHHLQIVRRPHWHIDYIGRYLEPVEIWYTCDAANREHQWATVLAKSKGATIPLAGFGSSDCRCQSHLYYFNYRPSGGYLRRKIHSRLDNHGRIYLVKDRA